MASSSSNLRDELWRTDTGVLGTALLLCVELIMLAQDLGSLGD